MAREVLLVGSVPLEPAMSVFKCACDHGLTKFLSRIPDGEQHGWALPMMKMWATHPALEPHGDPVQMTRRPTTYPIFSQPQQMLHLKPGHSAEELAVADMGVARGVAESYEQFKRAKAEGMLPAAMRFVATVAGPGTTSAWVFLPFSEMGPVMRRIYRGEIERILEVVPHDELAIQIDLAAEVELEEYRRRPEAWDSPRNAKKQHNWPFEDTTSLIAEISDLIPEPVELGFHLCAFYHIDESQGQDLNVHVDWCNTLTRKIRRVINYIHMPTTPTFDTPDFEPLRRLALNSRTKLYLGVIHAEDGVEGAARRIRAAAKVRPDFGVASFCGLRVPSRAQWQNPIPIDKVLDMHRTIAEVAA